MAVVPKHACRERRLARPSQGSPSPTPPPPRTTLTLPGAQLYSQHGRPGELLPTTLVPADGCVQLPLQLAEVLSPKTWCGREAGSEEQKKLWSPGTRPTGRGHSPGGAGV